MKLRIAGLVSALTLAACGRPEAAAVSPAAPAPIEHAELGLRLTGLPAGLVESGRDADGWSFAAALAGVDGTVAITVTPRRIGSINLVEEAKEFGAAAAAAPGGKFFGGNELVTPTGPAYAARALVDGGAVEERRIFLLHPADDDLLVTLALRYPPSTPEVARDRFQQLIDLLSALEALPAPGAAAPAAAAPPS
jgi:hypothetical protein